MDREYLTKLVSEFYSKTYLDGLGGGDSKTQGAAVEKAQLNLTNALDKIWGAVEAATAYSENELALRALLKKHPTEFTAGDRAEIKRRTHMSFHLQNAVLILTEELKGYQNA